MDWPTLEQKCKELLENPQIRKQDSELKYLVIDYTQFDDWSSEEDILEHQNYGIGKILALVHFFPAHNAGYTLLVKNKSYFHI